MLAVRVLASRSLRRRVAWLLFSGAVLNAVADIGLLVFYLVHPDGTAPGVYNLCYLVGLACFALAGVLALLPGPPPVPAGARTGRWLPIAVALSATLPAVVLNLPRHSDMPPMWSASNDGYVCAGSMV